MTAPIQEPTTERALQGFAYQRDQIFRRPSRTAFVPTLFRGRQITGGFQSIGSGVEVQLTWNAWENGDTSVFTDAVVGGLLQSVILEAEGLYLIQFMVSIDTLTSTAQLVMVMNDQFDSPTQVVYPAEIPGAGADYLYPADVRSYPPFASADAGDPEISFDIAHNHGSSRNTRFGTAFEIVYLGPFRSEESS